MHGRRPEAEVNFVRPRLIKYLTLSILALVEKASNAIKAECDLISVELPLRPLLK